jgi:hypothetical protein
VVEEEKEKSEELLPDKADIKAALSLIPPASALKSRERRLLEKRIRLKYDPSLEREEAKINPQLAKELDIKDKLEIVVAGRHRFVFRAIIDDEVEYNRVHVNPELMEENGVADNSIATVRSYKGTERLGVRLEV